MSSGADPEGLPRDDLSAVLRTVAPQALAALMRRYGNFAGGHQRGNFAGGDQRGLFGTAEDAVQEAMLAAAQQWPTQGMPANPRGWLITVASRRLIDWHRRDQTRRSSEAAAADFVPAQAASIPGPEDEPPLDRDDSLALLFLCCHPALAKPAQVALTLRAVGGLGTPEIAAAFLVPEATMAQRIVRAKQRIRATGIPFAMPPDAEFGVRLDAVLQVLYLIFNEGYIATSGPQLQRTELTTEAIRLARQLHHLRPNEGEVTGLLALMLLTESRRDARTRRGALVPLSEQDRTLWNGSMIEEGVALVGAALAESPVGPYQLQAAIAAVHAQAANAGETDWTEILALYRLLEMLTPTPIVAVNRAVATAMVDGPEAGLAMLDSLDSDVRLAGNYRLAAVRAHLLEMNGQLAEARDHFERAARATTSLPERNYLRTKAGRLP